MWSPKSRKKSVNKIFLSQRNTNQNFGLPDGKFWSPIFLLRIRTKRTRLGPQWRFIHLPLKNHDKRIECRLYTQFNETAIVLCQLNPFSCLYLLEKKYTRFKKNCRLVLCSMFKTVNDLSFRDLSRRSTDRHVVCIRPQLCSISRSKNMAAKLRTAQAVKHCDRFIIIGKLVLYSKSSGKVKSK